MILIGYIDESFTGEEKPLTFGLNCLIAKGNEWFWISSAWRKVLEKKNAELVAANRAPIKRLHTADFNNLRGDFKEWTPDERTAFTKLIIQKVFEPHHILSVGFTINLQELNQIWPEVGPDVKAFAYDIMLRLIMIYLAKTVPENFEVGTRVTLIHERCPYDGVLRGAFNRSLRKEPKHKELFTTLTPMGWEVCIPLQPADFMAYEAMKETHRFRPGDKQRPRRLSLESLLQVDSFGARCDEIPGEAITEWKRTVDEKTMKQIKHESETARESEQAE